MPNGCPKSCVAEVLRPIVIKKLIYVACALASAGAAGLTVPTTCTSPVRVFGSKNPRVVSARALVVKASITAQATAERIASLLVGIMFIFIGFTVVPERKASLVPKKEYGIENVVRVWALPC